MKGIRRFCLLLVLLCRALSARAGPDDGAAMGGSATISSSGGLTTITQGSGRAIIKWQDFSSISGESRRFLQPNALSATLNRVVSGAPPALSGPMAANGKIFLINPNGMLVGAGARIDTGGCLASTLDVTNASFLAGAELRFTGESTAAVQRGGRGGNIETSGGFLDVDPVDWG